ncbi:MerR family transcriptional regulator/heat shock protein HspR [Micrococcus sp. TA1]|nr:MerR family transcriptional regulator/heat shock protein HspR [Micrococcus sp. TA1]
MTTAWEDPLYVISVAAELAGMHPQTLRQYDRMGLVVPQRQGGRQRRYSRQDVDRLRTIQQLSREGVSLEGIRRIVALEDEVERLQQTVADLAGQIQAFQAYARYPRVFAAGAQGDVTTTFDAGPDREAAEQGYAAARRRGAGQRGWPRRRPAAALTAGPSSSSALTPSARTVSGVLVWKPKN